MDINGYAFVIGGGKNKSCLMVSAPAYHDINCLLTHNPGVESRRPLAWRLPRPVPVGVLVADINLTTAEQTAQDCSAVAANPTFRAEAVQLDITLEDSVKRATAKMMETFGRIDYCVNGAGVSLAYFL